MATCPNCNARDRVSLDRRLVTAPVGDFSLAGVQIKFAAQLMFVLACDIELGGCGWTIAGEIDGDYFVQKIVIKPGANILE